MNIQWKQIAADVGNLSLGIACSYGVPKALSSLAQSENEPDLDIRIYLTYNLLQKTTSDYQSKYFQIQTENKTTKNMIAIAKAITSFVIANAILALSVVDFKNTSASKMDAFVLSMKGFMILTGVIALPHHLIHWAASKTASYITKSGDGTPPEAGV